MAVLTAMAALGGLTLVLASALAMASIRFQVEEDPRVERVDQMLPHANCGACGYPGCRPFAEALVAGEASPAGCTVSTEEGRRAIAAFLGVDVGAQEKRVARLACAGGTNVARNRAHYDGLATCAAASAVGGGPKGCVWGCLGLGDCERACDFDAIAMSRDSLPVVDPERCTACGDCVSACPKDLFSLQPVSHRLWVACRNLQAGDAILDECRVACTACGRCAHDAPEVISMRNNLPVIDYARPGHSRDAIDRCPTGAIVWLQPDGSAERGRAAPAIVRRTARPDATT